MRLFLRDAQEDDRQLPSSRISDTCHEIQRNAHIIIPWFREKFGNIVQRMLSILPRDGHCSSLDHALGNSSLMLSNLGEHEEMVEKSETCLVWDGSRWLVDRNIQARISCSRRRNVECSLSQALDDPRRRMSKRRRLSQGIRSKANEWISSVSSIMPGQSAAVRRNMVQHMCSLCCEPCLRGMAVQLACGHGWYCTTCQRKHAEARLDLGDVEISCPECPCPIAEVDLRRLLPVAVVDRLLSQSLERAVSMASDLYACPTPDCPMRVALDNDTEACLNCELCGKWSCVLCGAQPYHVGETCQQHIERQRSLGQARDEELLFQWIRRTGSKQCPKCKVVITKENLGKQSTQYAECHKMLCRNCNTRFCFKCLAILTNKYSCGCSDDRHGFINPFTGNRLTHTETGKNSKRSDAPCVNKKLKIKNLD